MQRKYEECIYARRDDCSGNTVSLLNETEHEELYLLFLIKNLMFESVNLR